MTLGGLALAVGILVDDATVVIENINRILEEGHETDIKQAILDGSQQVAVPALVSTLCICIVFMPLFLLSGVARYLFVPLAEAVVFAMLASYFFSRTLVPTLAMYMLKLNEGQGESHNPLVLFSESDSSGGFARVRTRHVSLTDSSGSLRRKDISFRRFFALPQRLSPGAMARAGFLPGYGQRPVQPARPREDRDAH